MPLYNRLIEKGKEEDENPGTALNKLKEVGSTAASLVGIDPESDTLVQDLGYEMLDMAAHQRNNPGLPGAISYVGAQAVQHIPFVKMGREYVSNQLDNWLKPIFKTNDLAAEGVGKLDNNPNVMQSKGITPESSDYSYRRGRPLKNPVWDNLSPKVQKQFTDAGIDSDNAKFFIENWTREVGATVEGLPFTDSTFNFMKGELLPKVLDDLKGIDLSDGLQLDHIAQLRAMTPFYKGRNLKQSNKIRRILIQEGIFGGHNPKNLKYLPTDVHTVKTKFWEQQVGKDGSKFFKGRKMKTYADIENAAIEMKEFINRSNDVVEKVSAQYRFMRKKNITAGELDKILEKVDLNFGTYNLKEVRTLIKEIQLDDLKRSEKGVDLLDEAIEAQTAKDSPLPYRYEDELPPTRKAVRSRKKQLDKNLRKETDKDTGQFDFLDDLFP